MDHGTVKSSYSLSTVNSSSGNSKGGLIGNNQSNGNITVTNCYWSPDLAGVTTSAGGTSLTKEEMTKQESYVGFDFTSESPIWIMKTYPELNYNFGGK